MTDIAIGDHGFEHAVTREAYAL